MLDNALPLKHNNTMATQLTTEMTCTGCNKIAKKNGRDRNDNQRYSCAICKKTFTAPRTKTLGNMYLPEDKALMCLQLLVEGMSIRSIERVTDINRNTIMSLLEVVGKKCLWIQENLVKDVKVKFVQVASTLAPTPVGFIS